jgi:hypothetical protein
LRLCQQPDSLQTHQKRNNHIRYLSTLEKRFGSAHPPAEWKLGLSQFEEACCGNGARAYAFEVLMHELDVLVASMIKFLLALRL